MRPWWRSAGLALGTVSALGFARFAYGLLVPAMRDQLGWTLATAGGLTTANGVGYLAGAAVTAAVARRFTVTVIFRAGMLITAASLAATAVSSDYRVLLAARAVAGLASALVFITGGVIASRMAASTHSTAPITIYFSGAGLGIALSGAGIPFLLQRHPGRWVLGWLGLAAGALLATLGSWAAARSDGTAAPAAAAGGGGLRQWWGIAAAYTLFGAGYITYITFLSAYLAARHAPVSLVAATWTLIGFSVVAAPVLWSRPIATWTGARVLATLLAAVAVAAAVPLLRPGWPAVLASAMVFGATFMAVPAAVTALLRAATPPSGWTALLAAFTVLFAAGQTIGPWLAGALADHTRAGATLGWTAVLCAVAAVLTATTQPWRRSMPSIVNRR